MFAQWKRLCDRPTSSHEVEPINIGRHIEIRRESKTGKLEDNNSNSFKMDTFQDVNRRPTATITTEVSSGAGQRPENDFQPEHADQLNIQTQVLIFQESKIGKLEEETIPADAEVYLGGIGCGPVAKISTEVFHGDRLNPKHHHHRFKR